MAITPWYESGYAGADREQEKRDLGGGPKRWWMPAATSKQIVFVDDSPVCFDEHSWRVEGSKFPLFATCTAKVHVDPCPGCSTKGVSKFDYTGHLTIVDITGYTSGKGTPKEKHVAFELVEFAPKLKAMNKLKIKKQNKGSLVGQLYTISRADENGPSTGDDFDHIREADMDKLYKAVTYRGKNVSEIITLANGTGEQAAKVRKFLVHQFQVPEDGLIPEQIPTFNYASVHAPMDIPDFRRAVSGAVGYAAKGGSSYGSGSAGTGAADSDDIPF